MVTVADFRTVLDGLPVSSVLSSTVSVPGLPTRLSHNQTLSRLDDADAVKVLDMLWVVPNNPRHDTEPGKACSASR